MCLLLENDKFSISMASKLFYCLLCGLTSGRHSAKNITGETCWQTDMDKLTAFNSIGQFDTAMLTPVWGTVTKQGLESAIFFIKKYGFELSSFLLSEIPKSPNATSSDQALLLSKFFKMYKKIIQSCLVQIGKEGEKMFEFAKELIFIRAEKNETIISFFQTLRIELISRMNKIIAAIKQQNGFQYGQKLTEKTINSAICVMSLFYDYSQLSEHNQLNSIQKGMEILRNPTYSDYIRKYSLYHDKMSYARQVFFYHYEKLYDHPGEESKKLLFNIFDIMIYSPQLSKCKGFIVEYIKNIRDNENEHVIEDIFLRLHSGCLSLIDKIMKVII